MFRKKEKEYDEGCAYTKWDISYKHDGDTFIVYKTRYRRPTWWPKNINSPGYKETIELATLHIEIQRRFIVSFWTTQQCITKIEYNKDIGFMDKLRVLDKAWYISKTELYRIA